MRLRMFKYMFIVLSAIVILLPFLLDALIKYELLTFSPGAIDAWIGFWGSYIGAIIGASVVYFVAKIQMKKQDEQQIRELELRGTYEMKREMKMFYTTMRTEKIEEFIHVTDEFTEVIRGLFYHMIQVANVLSDPDIEEREKVEMIEEIKLLGEPDAEKGEVLAGKVDHLCRYIYELDDERVKILILMQKLKAEWESIEENYEKYVLDQDAITGGLNLFGVPKEASDEITRISQMLKATLRNIQVSLGEM